MRKRSISLTPLIDVVFLLLVFFMLSSHFQKFSYLDLTIPKGTLVETDKKNIVAVDVINNERISIADDEILISDLINYISKLSEQEIDAIQIMFDDHILLQTIVEIIEIFKAELTSNIIFQEKEGLL